MTNQTGSVNGNRDSQFDLVKMCVIRRFMMTATFENDVAEDYVTEKLYQPLLAGSLPVNAGAPNVDSYERSYWGKTLNPPAASSSPCHTPY